MSIRESSVLLSSMREAGTIQVMRTLILECNEKVGDEVRIEGFVQTRRDHGRIMFLDVADRSGQIQVVLSGELVGDLHPQDVVAVEGKISSRPQNLFNLEIATGKIELQAEKVDVLSKAAELPFDMGGKDLDLQLPTLLDYRALTLRHPKQKDIFRLQEILLKGFREASQELDCTEVVVPTISASSTEGGAEVFKFDYFGHQAFLTQSPQLYKQMVVPIFERVMTIAHAYRSEPSVTTRHLTEATQLDMEMGFTDFNQLLDLTERVAQVMFTKVNEEGSQILEKFGVDKILLGKFPRLKLREAQEIIFKETGRDNRQEKDLEPQDEIDICEWARKNHQTDFVIVTHFPTKKRAFYSMPDPSDSEYSLSHDVLFRGLEILSGAIRINDYDRLVEAIKDRGMDPKNFELYLQAFKYGMPPEGGFSYGLERMTKQALKLGNVREASLFPRDMERVDLVFNKQS